MVVKYVTSRRMCKGLVWQAFSRFGIVALAATFFAAAAPTAAQAQDVDWLINLSDSGFDPSPAGTIAKYNVVVTNNGFGPASAPATTLTIGLPANTILQGQSGTITNCRPLPSTGPSTITCDVPQIAPNGATASVALDVKLMQAGTVQLTASVPTAGDSDTANNAEIEGTTVTQGADTQLQVLGPATAASGSLVSYDFRVTNNGPNTVSNVVVSFPIPTGLANISPPAGCTLGGSTYTCTIAGPISTGSAETISFGGQISAASPSTVTPLASITGASLPDADTANNTASVNTTVTGGTDLSITKSRSPSGQLLVGSPVTFTLASQYTGDNPNAITITDTVPPNYRIDSVVPASGWSCTVLGQQITCTLTGGTGAGDNVALPSIVVNATTQSAGSVTNSAAITAAGPSDPNASNNNATDGGATIVVPTVDLAAVKTGPNPALIVQGNTYNFQIGARNDGTAAFFGTLEVTDALPAGLEVTNYTLNGWSCTPAPVVVGPTAITCSRIYTDTPGGRLDAGAATPTAVLQTRAVGTGVIVNSASVGSPNANIADTNPANDTTAVSVTSSAPTTAADIAIVKTSSASPIAGEPQTFDFVISNAGPQPATNVTFTDTFTNLTNNTSGGAGNGLVSFSAPGATCSTASAGGRAVRLTCTGLTVPVCSGATCPSFSAVVTPGGNGGARSNTAEVISNAIADPNLTNNTSSVAFTVAPRADMTVTKVASPDPVGAGQNVTYVIAARNIANGLSEAAGVQITDTLPANVTFISASPSAGSCATTPTPNTTTLAASNNQISCQLGTIGNGSQRTVTVVVRPNLATRGTTLSNTASVTTTTTEPNLGNNSATATVSVVDPELDLLVNKSESVDPLTVGLDTVYTVVVSNPGPSAAENLVVTDLLPASGVEYRSHTTSAGGSCPTVPAVGALNGTLTCNFPFLLAGETATVTVTARGVSKGTVGNRASAASDESAAGFDRDAANNAVIENTTVRTRADVEVVSKVASPGTVRLLDNFVYTIVVRNNSGVGLQEADNVIVEDTLPAALRLTGTPTISVTTGSATLNSCTGTAGSTAFTCNLGTFSSGGVAEITVPVEAISATAHPAVIANTASIKTSSFDSNATNNSATGPVTVNSSSIAGTAFRDFNSDAAQNGIDSGIAGVSITLSGTDVDGNAVTRTVTTAADGSYTIDFLPAGTYSVTRGAVSESFLSGGASAAGSVGGVTASATLINNISLGPNVQATGYLFSLVPQARIGIAKSVQSGPTANADGSVNTTFRLLVENLSLESLNNIVVTDALAGASPLFGTHTALATPATDPLARGTYTMLSAPSGSCGGLQAGYNGSTSQTVASGFTLAAGGTCTIDLAIRIQPTVPLPAAQPSGGIYENQATVAGAGAASGQTSATNALLRDVSDSGTDPDPNGDGNASGPGESDPTPVTPTFSPAIALIKTADVSALSTPPAIGDTITYRFTVTNTGDQTLSNITLSDTLPGIVVSGGPIASLAPGASDSSTFRATYRISQADLDATRVTNSATVTGTDPLDRPITDTSGTTNTDNTPLSTPLASAPAIALVKTDDSSGLGTPATLGQTIQYRFAVTNTGNVTLTNVTLADSLPGVALSGGPIASLAPGATDTTTFTGSYNLTQADLDLGRVENSAVVTGAPVAGPPNVSDTSGTSNSNDTPTVTLVNQRAAITLVKSVDDSRFESVSATAGQTLNYSFAVTNTGLQTLTNITLTDPLPGVVIAGGPIASLAPGATDSATFTGSYTITASDVAAGELSNTATVTGTFNDRGTSRTVTDDDSAKAVLVPVNAEPETFPPFTTDGGVTTSILASDTVRNQPATLTNVNLSVVASDPAVTLDPSTGLITLSPGNPAGAYTVTYQICDALNPTACDTAVETVVQGLLPALETTKTQTVVDNGDGVTGVGDTIQYTITVKNTGNTALENIALVDTLTSLSGTSRPLGSGPTFVSASSGSSAGRLRIGETATYTATYLLSSEDVVDGGVRNSVSASGRTLVPAGVSQSPTTVNDVSDDGIDSDGNIADDPTELFVAPSLLATGLTLEKTTPFGVVQRGQVVPYTVTLSSDNPVVSGSFTIIDVLPSGLLYVPGSATLNGVTANVSVNGRAVTWPNVPVAPFSTVSLTLQARVTDGAGPGELVNTAAVRNPATGALVPPLATATVRIMPEAVFDCGDVIGKVYNDRNRDGYQTPAGTTPSSTDERAETGRLSGEPGLPDVRLVGVDGLTITTDQHGRFHVPCAMLPNDRGSNFILKLDTRTLPAGFRMTTENPRVIRLTPGKLSEMNFGAALTPVMRVDLNSAAFVSDADGRVTLAPQLADGLERALRGVQDTPVNIRLAFHLPEAADAEAEQLARARMRLVEQHIRKIWHDIGQVKLIIERTLVRTIR